MTGFNHVAVGGFIAKFLPLPLAIPVAFLSHFVLDSLPHYGIEQEQRDSHFWRIFWIADFMLAIFYLGGIATWRHHYSLLICGLVAVSPDLLWVLRVIRTHSFNLSEHKSRFTRWHAEIQHFERPWGIYIEVPLTVVLGYLAARYW